MKSPFKVGDLVQVFCKYGDRREAIGTVVELVECGVAAEWPEPSKSGTQTRRETFGPRGGGNADWKIRPYSAADQAADKEFTRIKTLTDDVSLRLRKAIERCPTYSEKELRALRDALKPFGGGA